MTEEILDISYLVNATRASALQSAFECMARARNEYEASDEKSAYSRLGTTGNRLERATYWNTRAQAFYALAALLPAE